MGGAGGGECVRERGVSVTKTAVQQVNKARGSIRKSMIVPDQTARRCHRPSPRETVRMIPAHANGLQ